jgi:hypothetical protein
LIAPVAGGAVGLFATGNGFGDARDPIGTHLADISARFSCPKALRL